MKMKHASLWLLIAATFVFFGCGAKTDKSSTAIKPPVAVEVLTLSPSAVTDGIEVTGSLEAKYWADVKTQIPGLVKEVYVTEWVRVRKGQKLARIDVTETEAIVRRAEASVEAAKAALAQVKVASTRSERELGRIQKLKESGLATQQALDDARSEYEASSTRITASQAQIRAAEEELKQARARLNKGLVLAPLDGVVAQRTVNVGDLASDAAAGSPIFRIVDNRLLNLTVTVPSQAASRVKVGQPLEFTVDSPAGKTFRGKVMFVNPELTASDRSLKVIVEIHNTGDELKAGLFAKGRIITGSRAGIMQIPRSALSTWDAATGKGNLFVIEGDAARMKQVVTGAVTGEMLEITSGVKAGDRVVSRGGFNLKDGDKASISTAAKK